MIRTFIAVNLDDKIREKIGELKEELSIKGIKPVEPELVHITLKFLGNVEEYRVDDIEKALKKVSVAPFQAKFSSLGSFPGTKNPRVIWIGAEGDFVELNRQVEDAMAEIGFEREGRFEPHVTIARVKMPSLEIKQRLPKFFEKHKDFYAGDMMVDSIYLMKSTLSPKGPRYDVVKEIRL
ncbi:RNA 2',3'-cyclic phosphodiesterase [Methanocella sp. CWC-04]|uniref:RNA 2',3'-cyclic phosphodiesterase n=1 Tax=Methanooceanicella nereidis TaxID=2052831 RepID=A0AAP2RCQ4_9EURY|nr:RNA 2',3'-cyclic phosphodiesterase [Methanocella sp. CWC-04]MCD1294697.1 RNA 2',3'-cyclic phosphodiesterase [Methanocella sp. CWC-04]